MHARFFSWSFLLTGAAIFAACGSPSTNFVTDGGTDAALGFDGLVLAGDGGTDSGPPV